MVEPEPEESRDRFRAEHVGGLETGGARREPDRAGRREQPDGGHELRIELTHRDDATGIERCPMGLSERDDRVVQLSARERVVGPERRDVRPHQPRQHDGRDLGRGPALHGRRGRGQVVRGGRGGRSGGGDERQGTDESRDDGRSSDAFVLVSDVCESLLIGRSRM